MPRQSPVVTPKFRSGVRFLSAAILLTVVVGCYNAILAGLARRHDDHQPRNRRTGVLIGAEELDLGPRNADSAVLLVHGFLGAANNFNELPQRLAAAGYRVRSLRLPGHGTTPFDLMETGPSDSLNYIIREIRSMQEQHARVFVIGHSMGGALSVLAATTTEIDGLVLAGPHFRVTHRAHYLLPVETWSGLTGWAIRWVYKSDRYIQVNRAEVKHDIVSYRYVPSKGTADIHHFAALARDPDTLSMVTCPVLLLHGDGDLAASPEAARRAFDRLASEDKSFVSLPKSNHHLFWDYDREQVYTAILDFIGRNERAALS